MMRDFHYYVIFALCRAVGFKLDDAHTVAFASQFVDDARINLIFFEKSDFELEHDTVDNKPAFFNMATCHNYFKVKTYNYEAMINNTVAFHFVPGAVGENFTKKLRCKEESPVILDILHDLINEEFDGGDLNEGIKKENLIKLGIVLHAYADTFSHQGFSGMISKVNDIKNLAASWKYLSFGNKIIAFIKSFNFENEKIVRLFDRFIPVYGHGQASTYPDFPCKDWSYEYDYEFSGSSKPASIRNEERYKRAFQRIKEHLEEYISQNKIYSDEDIKFANYEVLIKTLLSEGTNKQREKKWKTVLVREKLLSSEELKRYTYRYDEWLSAAFNNYDSYAFDARKVDKVRLADDFLSSDWYYFYLSVKWYKKKFFEYCAKHELVIPH